jgi:asparagine synthase (glutamine-hydrolysing)
LGEVVRLNENEVGRKPNKYFQKTNDGKQILRDMMSKYIPTEIVEAKKQGFSSPDASWFKGESIEFVKERLLSHNSNIYEFLEKKVISEIIEEHLSGKVNRRLLIWSLLNFDYFLDGYLK